MGTNQMIPLRWMAPETLRSNTNIKFSIASDVWAFGITLWEIYNLGELPYSQFNNKDVSMLITNGMAMPVPDKCPESVKNVIAQCWRLKPSCRCSFDNIVTMLENENITDVGPINQNSPKKAVVQSQSKYISFEAAMTLNSPSMNSKPNKKLCCERHEIELGCAANPDRIMNKKKEGRKRFFFSVEGIFILFILVVISISLLSIATIYIIDYHERQDSNENSVLSVTLQNGSHIIEETIEVFEHENPITKGASLQSVMTTMVSIE